MYEFSEIFYTGQLEGLSNKQLCGHALNAWGSCMAGAKPPDRFAEVMDKIGRRLGITPVPENFMEYSKTL